MDYDVALSPSPRNPPTDLIIAQNRTNRMGIDEYGTAYSNTTHHSIYWA
jgi:hypothetical protein